MNGGILEHFHCVCFLLTIKPRMESRQCTDRTLANSKFKELKQKVESVELGTSSGGGTGIGAGVESSSGRTKLEDVNTTLAKQNATLECT